MKILSNHVDDEKIRERIKTCVNGQATGESLRNPDGDGSRGGCGDLGKEFWENPASCPTSATSFQGGRQRARPQVAASPSEELNQTQLSGLEGT